MENELISNISNIGFPIAISVYLLIRFEGKLVLLSNSITELSKTVLQLQDRINK